MGANWKLPYVLYHINGLLLTKLRGRLSRPRIILTYLKSISLKQTENRAGKQGKPKALNPKLQGKGMIIQHRVISNNYDNKTAISIHPPPYPPALLRKAATRLTSSVSS